MRAMRASSAARDVIVRLCGDAHAPICAPRGRTAK
jgi:hypothetical protein